MMHNSSKIISSPMDVSENLFCVLEYTGTQIYQKPISGPPSDAFDSLNYRIIKSGLFRQNILIFWRFAFEDSLPAKMQYIYSAQEK